MAEIRTRKRAFVLAGGGARGALQIGALRALLEADICPDFLVGTSVGAVNAAFLSIYGFNASALDKLEAAWRVASKADLLPANVTWLTVRVLFNRLNTHPYQRLREYFVAQGLSPDLRFADLPGPPSILVSADLNSAQPVYFGAHPQDSVLDGVVASTALPPWVHPVNDDGRFLMDGGAVSNLPIEPAILHGATEIIALNLDAPAAVTPEDYGFGPFWAKLMTTIGARQIYMERRLAQALGIPLYQVDLAPDHPLPLWDFSQTERMFLWGYEQMQAALSDWQLSDEKPGLWYKIKQILGKGKP